MDYYHCLRDRSHLPAFPPRDISVEEGALFFVRRNCPTKTKLVAAVTAWMAGGPRWQRMPEYITAQPKAIRAVERLIAAGVIIRSSKHPHHIRLGV